MVHSNKALRAFGHHDWPPADLRSWALWAERHAREQTCSEWFLYSNWAATSWTEVSCLSPWHACNHRLLPGQGPTHYLEHSSTRGRKFLHLWRSIACLLIHTAVSRTLEPYCLLHHMLDSTPRDVESLFDLDVENSIHKCRGPFSGIRVISSRQQTLCVNP